jgi:hypothetical protein
MERSVLKVVGTVAIDEANVRIFVKRLANFSQGEVRQLIIMVKFNEVDTIAQKSGEMFHPTYFSDPLSTPIGADTNVFLGVSLKLFPRTIGAVVIDNNPLPIRVRLIKKGLVSLPKIIARIPRARIDRNQRLRIAKMVHVIQIIDVAIFNGLDYGFLGRSGIDMNPSLSDFERVIAQHPWYDIGSHNHVGMELSNCRY